jgi:translation initiation factor 3 subunit A
VGVGERVQAVTSLHNLLTSRRVKTWSQTMEDIMMLYIDLCVELKKVSP